MASLTLTDKADGSGLTAAVVADAPGDVWAVYAGLLGNPAALAFVVNVVGTDDATVPGQGPLTVLAVPVAFTASPMSAVLAATNGTQATATQLRKAVKAAIELLGLPIVEVVEQWTPDETDLAYPVVILTPENTAETTEGSMNLTDDIGYPVRVMIADKQEHYDHDALPDYELWRQKIADRFRNKQLASMPSNVICRIEWDGIINPNLPKFMYAVSELVVRGVCREPNNR